MKKFRQFVNRPLPLKDKEVQKKPALEPEEGLNTALSEYAFAAKLEAALNESRKEANWIKPDDKALKNEYDVEYQHHFKHEFGDSFPTFDHFKNAVNSGKVVDVNSEFDHQIGNRSHTKSFESLHNLISGYRSYPKYRNRQTLTDLHSRIKNGEPVHMPIIMKHKDGSHHIFSGNSRLDISSWHYPKAKAISVDVP